MNQSVNASILIAAMALAGCSSVALPAWDPDGSQASSAPAGGAAAASQGQLPLDELPPARNWTEYRLRAADRINRANPQLLYPGSLPGVFQAIPVLRVHLTADGGVSRVEVVREPGQSPETVKIATDAIYRAAPFGPTSQLPAPAQFTETFLFNEQLRFRLRTTVEGR